MLLSKAKNLLQEEAKERTAASVQTGGRAWTLEVMFAAEVIEAVEILMAVVSCGGQAVVVTAPSAPEAQRYCCCFAAGCPCA